MPHIVFLNSLLDFTQHNTCLPATDVSPVRRRGKNVMEVMSVIKKCLKNSWTDKHISNGDVQIQTR